MFARLRPNTIAGLLSLLAAVLVGTIWYIYLFVAPVIPRLLTLSAIESIRYTFSPDNASRWYFVGLAALFVCPAAVGVAYLLNVSGTQTGAMFLFVVLIVLGLGAFALTNWSLALFIAMPALWGYRCVHAA